MLSSIFGFFTSKLGKYLILGLFVGLVLIGMKMALNHYNSVIEANAQLEQQVAAQELAAEHNERVRLVEIESTNRKIELLEKEHAREVEANKKLSAAIKSLQKYRPVAGEERDPIPPVYLEGLQQVRAMYNEHHGIVEE